MQLVERLEVVRQPVAQVLGLANVDDAPLAVTPLVYARLRGNVGGFRTEQVASIPQQGRAVLVHSPAVGLGAGVRYCGFP